VKEHVSFEVFSEVLSFVGRAYSIDSALLRPEDTFMALGKIDSWMLGEGESRIAEWLGEKGVNRPPQLHSVLDLAKFVQSLSGVTGAR